MDFPRVSGYRLARRGSSLMAARASDEGWTLVGSSRQSSEYSSLTTSAAGYALLRRSHFSTPSAALFSLDIIESVLQEITQAHPGAFCDDTGRYGSRNLRQPLACRIWIQGKVAQQGESQRKRSETPSTISVNDLQRN